MSGFFPDNVIDEIRDKCNIAEVISQYIPLKRAGRNFRALCPFHHEKTPSFMVSPDKGIFHCFGCGAGGNVFNFVMKHEGLEFPQVVRILAEKTGVRLPQSPGFERKQKASSDLFQLNEMACGWFQDNLKKAGSRSAVEYLKKRAVEAKTALTFRLGFAAQDNGLLNFMRSKGCREAEMEKAGLIIRNDNGRYYDRFRQRLIFPIFDSRSRVLGFGGRVLDNFLPKYLNSPETAIYSKGRHLYGLNLAKGEIKAQDFCIIVEGYMDLLAVYQSGTGNVVASLGTALTVEQIRLLKRYTRNVVMIFDSDRAGELASLRNLDLLIEEDVNVKVVALPTQEDPDSFLRKFGREKFSQKITKAADLFDYKLNLLAQRHDLSTVEGKVGIAREMLATIHHVANAVRRGSYVKRLAQEFSRGEKSMGEEWILTELKKLKRGLQPYKTEAPAQSKVLSKRPAEEMLLKIILKEENAAGEVRKHLDLEDFQDLRIREMMRLIYTVHSKGEEISPAKLIGYLESEEEVSLISRIFTNLEELIDCRKSLNDCIKRIKTDSLRNRLNKLQREIKLAQNWGHRDKITELVGKYNHLIKQK
jgi:DNA primase